MLPHHRPGGGFQNPWPGEPLAGFGAFLKWVLWERLTKPRPRHDPSLPMPVTPRFFVPRAGARVITVTWVGHASFLVQIGGLNVLIDPMWSERASPVGFAGPRRHTPPGVPFDALPPVDVILHSHDHYDHLDDATVRRLTKRFPEAVWATPLGLGPFMRTRGARDVRQLDWWGDTGVGEVVITATPARHFSGRSLASRNRALWCGWAVRARAGAVWFAGDSAYHPEFGLIGARLGPFAASLVPIGAYEPRWFMRPVHMNPEEAVQAFVDVGSRAAFVPMHWGTFKLTDEPLDEPPRRVRAAWAAAGLPPDDLWLLAPGETRVLGPPD
jgi:N-acyl-phosphatidylethanolamine-hydrolysing phospholipase D